MSRDFSEVDVYPEQWPEDLIDDAQIGMEDIFAVQSLVMTYVRAEARTKVTDRKNKRYGACLINTTGDSVATTNVYDGSIDTYLSCMVRKLTHDQWRMSVRFTEAWNLEELMQQNVTEHYEFDWLRNGNRAAWFTSTFRRKEGRYHQRRVYSAIPIDQEMCDNLQDRILTHTQNATSLIKGS